MTSDCVFCKIVGGQIPSTRLHEDEHCICIRDLNPQARTHLLVIPKHHVVSLDELFAEASPENGGELMGKLFEATVRIARQHGLLPGGFRTIVNTGKGGGQSVFHLHLHLMAGETVGARLV